MKIMKKLLLAVLSFLIAAPVFAQKEVNGFSEEITINGESYLVSDALACLDYRLIAKRDCFKSMIGKFPAYGVIDGSNKVIVPCECSGVMFEPKKGCILILHSNKQLLKSKFGIVDFNGKEIIPVSIDMKTSFSNPDKKVWKHYDDLPADVKEQMMEVYKQKKALFDAKMGR